MEFYRYQFRPGILSVVEDFITTCKSYNRHQRKAELKKVRNLSVNKLEQYYIDIANRFLGSVEQDHPQLVGEHQNFYDVMLGVRDFEKAHRQSGRIHICIPDKETFGVVQSIKIENIKPDTVRWLYQTFCVSVPADSFGSKASELYRNSALTTRFLQPSDDPYMKIILERRRGQTGGGAMAITNTFPIEGIINVLEHESVLLDGLTEDDKKVADDWAVFVFKLLIMLQVLPNCLKDGPGYVELNSCVDGKGRVKHRKGKTAPTLVLDLPEGYKKAYTARLVPPHFRALRSPRYRREDDEGNILPVGEPGHVRIIQVKGYMSAGHVKHVDKDTTIADAVTPQQIRRTDR